MQETFEIKNLSRIGPGASSSGRYLKRIIGWTAAGCTWEADPKHVPLILEEQGLLQAKPKAHMGDRGTGSNMPEATDELDRARAGLFQRVTGRLIYLALDRVDIQFPVKEAAADMAAAMAARARTPGQEEIAMPRSKAIAATAADGATCGRTAGGQRATTAGRRRTKEAQVARATRRPWTSGT